MDDKTDYINEIFFWLTQTSSFFTKEWPPGRSFLDEEVKKIEECLEESLLSEVPNHLIGGSSIKKYLALKPAKKMDQKP